MSAFCEADVFRILQVDAVKSQMTDTYKNRKGRIIGCF